MQVLCRLKSEFLVEFSEKSDFPGFGSDFFVKIKFSKEFYVFDDFSLQLYFFQNLL